MRQAGCRPNAAFHELVPKEWQPSKLCYRNFLNHTQAQQPPQPRGMATPRSSWKWRSITSPGTYRTLDAIAFSTSVACMWGFREPSASCNETTALGRTHSWRQSSSRTSQTPSTTMGVALCERHILLGIMSRSLRGVSLQVAVLREISSKTRCTSALSTRTYRQNHNDNSCPPTN